MWLLIFVIISVVKSSFLLQDEKLVFSCGHSMWQCRDGSCISINKKCNGVADCADSSDEEVSLCSKTLVTKSGACILPPYPQHGTYVVDDHPNARPGDSHVSFALTVRCRQGYGPMDSDGDRTGSEQVYCVNGKLRKKMPVCVRFCKLDPDPSLTYMCYLPGKRIEVCKNYVPPGTSVDPVCNSPFYYSTEVFPNMRCISGFWDYVALCKAECGRIAPGGQPLVIGGKEAKHGDLPWHVGIYWKFNNHHSQICGGSLVSNNAVISAAHCFWSDKNKRQPASNYAVGVGKVYRLWDNEEDVFAQKSDVKEIWIPGLFLGEANNFQEDIAVVLLTTPFVYTIYIRPVCLNFNSYFDTLQLTDGNVGKIAGWGLTSANGQAAQTLRVVELPYINVDKCVKSVPQSFLENLTSDKFCAGDMNGTAMCKGDSGGGLCFFEKELGIPRYYLRGVVSVAPRDATKLCNDLSYYMFTKITKHQEFIKEALAASGKKTCPGYSYQCADGSCVNIGSDCDGKFDCADGSDESDEVCLVGTFSSSGPQKPPGACIFPQYPGNGTYQSEDFPEARPGQSRDAFELTVSCSHGYGFDPYTGLSSQQVFCINGVLSQEMPKCIRYCKLDTDPSIRYMCHIPKRAVEVCPQYVSPAAEVDPICNRPIYYTTAVLPYMKCESGSWNYIPLCRVDCGRVTPSGTPLVIGGESAKRGELPWHVGIYRKTTKPLMQIGGGTLITNNIVITAAHTFWSDVKKLLPASDYAVGIGKLYRPWNNEMDVGAQKSDVKEIKIPDRFQGGASNFAGDIAVVILTTPFNYTVFVRPVCLDLDEVFNEMQLQHGKLGKVAGWGLTSPNGLPSPVLKTVDMPFVNVVTCLKTVPRSFEDYITNDKFCAGYTNGTALCKGDNGGGLVFPDNERGELRYYLRGIVSAAPSNDDLCNSETLVTLTSVVKHTEFIKASLTAAGVRTDLTYQSNYNEKYCRNIESHCFKRPNCDDGFD